ncbi:MAG: peptidoglycan DD-metalloendopeptidase family protein [Candidatus Cloacimonetes bacterium]|nr:peptidoglycan DD-metalloendopeptidase family protein [Candidatus Cloacimonadota bacterium]
MNFKFLFCFIILIFPIMLFPLSSNPVYYTPSEEYHIVKPGESLQAISEKYSLSVDNLKLFNSLSSDRIFSGQKIYLIPKITYKTEFITVRSIPKRGYHIVNPRESIHRISKMYDLSILEIMEFNNLKSFTTKVGQKIYLKKIMKEKKIPKQDELKTEKTSREPAVEKTKIKENIKFSKTEDLFVPVRGTVTSEFGLRNGKPHKGIDISAPIGDPIFAVQDGKVVYVGNQRGYGNIVILEHKNYVMTVYAHNDANLVRLGEDVKRGQPIATLGQTGTTSGPHLHFEYRIKGKAINPREVFPSL